MMILYSTPASPFGRKVKIAAQHLDLADRIDVRPADVNDADDPLLKANPVGKIPALVLEDGTTLFDSRVILDYLDHLAGGNRILPASPESRYRAMVLQAACDGLLDAAILQVYERRYRPEEKRHQPWIDRQADKVSRTLAALETHPTDVDGAIHVGAITKACALGYLDFRFDGAWRAAHPNLVAWLTQFEQAVPAFAATQPSD